MRGSYVDVDSVVELVDLCAVGLAVELEFVVLEVELLEVLFILFKEGHELGDADVLALDLLLELGLVDLHLQEVVGDLFALVDELAFLLLPFFPEFLHLVLQLVIGLVQGLLHPVVLVHDLVSLRL